MGKKEFQKKYMHPTRRKLAEMVFTGEYDKNPSSGWTPNTEEGEHEVGDEWEDEQYTYRKLKDGTVTKEKKSSKIFQETRQWLAERKKCQNPDCRTFKKSIKDERLISKTGYCINCLSDLETEIRHHGIFEDYVKYRTYTNMLKDGMNKIELLKEQRAEAKQVHEYVNEDGTFDKWEMPQPVDEFKEELTIIIENGKKELKEIEEKRDTTWKHIVESNFDETKIKV